MPAASFRVFYNNQPATQDQLDQIETITVEQEVDMAWEARLTVPICTDSRGVWQGDDEAFMRSFSRVRIEIKVGSRPFVPLIDGPVVGYDSQRNSEPGQSQIVLIVQDDSVYLNRQEDVEVFEDRTDSQVARQLYENVTQIGAVQIEDTPPAPQDLPPVTVRRGTAMSLLRKLAERQGMHAFVLPGGQPGQSVGCFKKLPRHGSGLPDLVLLGNDRNIENFDVTLDAQSPARVQSYALNITDHAVLSSQSSFRNLDLLGDENTLPDESLVTRLLARVGLGNTVDLDQRVAGDTERSSYDLTATGSVIADCYPAALSPYRLVQVLAVNSRSSGNYLIHQVTHTLDRSSYSQSFTLKRNAVTRPAGSSTADLIGTVV